MQPIEFTVYGIPKPQGRPRAFVRGRHASVYNSKTADDWKACVHTAAVQHMPGGPLEGPLRVDVDYFLPRPKALCRKKDPDGPIPCPKKPDRDNLDKATLDALTQAGAWGDDSQVCDGVVRKLYTSKTGKTGARIRITKVESLVMEPLV